MTQVWQKYINDPPDYRDWLCCLECGHLSLKTRPPNVYASELGEPCMYCGTPIVDATYDDMKRNYPDGQYRLVEIPGEGAVS